MRSCIYGFSSVINMQCVLNRLKLPFLSAWVLSLLFTLVKFKVEPYLVTPSVFWDAHLCLQGLNFLLVIYSMTCSLDHCHERAPLLEVPGWDVQHKHEAASRARSSSRGLITLAGLLERAPFSFHFLHLCPSWSWEISEEDKYLKESRTKGIKKK